MSIFEYDGVYTQHLAAPGEGLHHAAFQVANVEAAVAQLKQKKLRRNPGWTHFGGARCAYFGIDRTLAYITQLAANVEQGKIFPVFEFAYAPEMQYEADT